jgi:hypothetical protein
MILSELEQKNFFAGSKKISESGQLFIGKLKGYRISDKNPTYSLSANTNF